MCTISSLLFYCAEWRLPPLLLGVLISSLAVIPITLAPRVHAWTLSSSDDLPPCLKNCRRSFSSQEGALREPRKHSPAHHTSRGIRTPPCCKKFVHKTKSLNILPVTNQFMNFLVTFVHGSPIAPDGGPSLPRSPLKLYVSIQCSCLDTLWLE